MSFSADGYGKLKELFISHLPDGKDRTAQLLADNCTVVIKGNGGRYCFASSSDVDLYIENYTSEINCYNTDNIDSVVDKVRSDLEDLYLDLCSKLEKQGYEQIEYEQSDEYIEETIIANEYEFTEDGKMY